VLTTVFDAIITRLNSDATLMTLMGKTVGDNPCYRAQRLSAITAPAVTLHENTEPSEMFPATDAIINGSIPNAFISTNSPVIQIDIWVSSQGNFPTTGRDADAIANRIDIILFQDSTKREFYDENGNAICDTHGWRRGGTSQQYEVDTSLWHNALRYQFSYYMMTGFVPG
jgi:hypothetical protein